jgi:hypothetical protein
MLASLTSLASATDGVLSLNELQLTTAPPTSGSTSATARAAARKIPLLIGESYHRNGA